MQADLFFSSWLFLFLDFDAKNHQPTGVVFRYLDIKKRIRKARSLDR